MLVEPRGVWEHSAYQSDNQFVLGLGFSKSRHPNKLVQGAGYAGEKLSLNFQNIEVRALLQVIADLQAQRVTSDTVTGNVTLRLKDVPWDGETLDIIPQAKNLGLRKSSNVILIARDELNAKEKTELEARQQIAALEPLRTQAFQLNYAKALDIANG